MSDHTPDQIHRILLEGYFLFSNAELCARWEISNYRLRKWRKASGAVEWTLEDCLIAWIYKGGWHEPADLVEYLDWRNHVRYTPDEIDEMFQNLVSWGEAEEDGGRYRYVEVDPSYIFGPRERGDSTS